MKTKINVVALTFSIATALIAPVALFGQSNNWTSVKAIPKSIDLIIERKRDDRVVGVLQAVTDDSIIVNSKEGSFIIGKDNVAKIYHAVGRDKKRAMNRGALYGMLIGLGAGVALATAFPPENEEMPYVGTFLAGGGIGTWAGIRYAKGKDKGPLVYSAR